MGRFSRERKTVDAGDFILSKSFSQSDILTACHGIHSDTNTFHFFPFCSVLFYSMLVMPYKIGFTTQGLEKGTVPLLAA